MKYGYLVVEGPHDVEVIGRLIKPSGLKRVQFEDKLDGYFRPLIPRQFPSAGDLLKRVEVPTFFASPSHVLAVRSAGGDSKLVAALRGTRLLSDNAQGVSIGIILDADSSEPATRVAELKKSLLADDEVRHLADLPPPGEVNKKAPRRGVFVLPDNCSQGTVEDLLLEAAEINYPVLLKTAQTFLDAVQSHEVRSTLDSGDLKDLDKPAGVKKANLSAMCSVLRPGKAIQNSIQDNRWLADAALTQPRIAALRQFLLELLELQ